MVIDPVPIVVGMGAAIILLISTYCWNWFPRRSAKKQTSPLYTDSQILIDTFMRGAMTKTQFRINACALGFSLPMVEDLIAQRDGAFQDRHDYDGEDE